MKPTFAAIISLCILAGCPTPPPVPPPGPGGETCDDACWNLGQMGCESGMPTPNGATCATVCTEARKGGVPWPVACVVAADSCAEADEC